MKKQDLKQIVLSTVVASFLLACGGDFPGQPSDVVRVNQTQYENGNLREELPYNKDSRIHGLKRTFYTNGQIKTEENYNNGKKEGPYKTYYSNGQIEAEGTYKDNKPSGAFKRYYENGNTEVEGNLIGIDKDGNPQYSGAVKSYFDDGKIQSEGNYNDKGKKDGVFKFYDLKGGIKSEESYKNDVRNGKFVEYRDGAVVKEQTYENGRLIQNPGQ